MIHNVRTKFALTWCTIYTLLFPTNLHAHILFKLVKGIQENSAVRKMMYRKLKVDFYQDTT